jgi:hypothetical protein
LLFARVPMTRWDLHALLRAAGMAMAALALGWVLTAATDEGGVSWGERAGRTLPLTPLCAAIGVWAALAPVRTRGEALALEALGRTPLQVSGAAVTGASAVAMAAAIAMATVGAVSVAGFYPTATHADEWRWDGAGGFVDVARGLRVGPDGAPAQIGPAHPWRQAPAIPRRGRLSAALATAVAGLAMTLLVADALGSRPVVRRPRRFGDRSSAVLAAFLAVGATIVLFQAAAARRAPPLLGVLPSCALLAMAVRRTMVRT